MRSTDLAALHERLSELADADPRGRHPTDRAMKVWFDTLKEFSIDDIQFVLVDMPKHMSRMPSPNDVFKACSEHRAKRMEREASIRRAAPGFTPEDWNPNSPVAKTELAKIKAILAGPRPGPTTWIDRVREREARYDPDLSFAAMQLAKQACARAARRDDGIEHE